MSSDVGFGYLSGAVPEGLAQAPSTAGSGLGGDAQGRGGAAGGPQARTILRAMPRQWPTPTGRLRRRLKSFPARWEWTSASSATPHIARLLNKMRIDVRHAAGPLRNRYKRQQPFVMHKTATCSPKDEALVANQGSYPSARGAVGWSYALAASRAEPGARAGDPPAWHANSARAGSFAGRTGSPTSTPATMLGRLVVARLHQNKAFAADFEAAKREAAQLRASGAKPSEQCNAPSSLASR